MCDHAATRASFAAFFGATRLIGGQDLPGEGWVLMGNCVACDSTLTIPIAEPRGSVVHGELEADRTARGVVGQDVIAPMTEDDWNDPRIR